MESFTIAGKEAVYYGSQPSETLDYRTTVHRVSQNPGAWRNSPLRDGLPAAVRTALDQAAKPDLKAALTALAECTARWDFDHAVRALEAAVGQGRIAYADIVALARRLAWDPPAMQGAGPDLRAYDALLRTGGAP